MNACVCVALKSLSEDTIGISLICNNLIVIFHQHGLGL